MFLFREQKIDSIKEKVILHRHKNRQARNSMQIVRCIVCTRTFTIQLWGYFRKLLNQLIPFVSSFHWFFKSLRVEKGAIISRGDPLRYPDFMPIDFRLISLTVWDPPACPPSQPRYLNLYILGAQGSVVSRTQNEVLA